MPAGERVGFAGWHGELPRQCDADLDLSTIDETQEHYGDAPKITAKRACWTATPIRWRWACLVAQ